MFYRGVLIVEIKLKPIRARVYLDLVDAVNGSLSPVQVAEHLGICDSLVGYHIKKLEEKGYIKRLDGRHNPQKYAKGPNSNLLDSALLQMGLQIHGGTVNPPPKSPILTPNSETALTIDVPTDRAHIDGRVTFPVLKVGSFNELRLKHGDDKPDVIIPLFPKEPYKNNNNVSRWLGKVTLDGKEYSIEFTESLKTGSMNLHIWPGDCRLTKEQVPGAEQHLISKTQDVANFISKHGAGWRFGIANANGTLHHGLADTAWGKAVPKTDRTINLGRVHLDHSPPNNGDQEPEINKDDKLVDLAMSLPERVEKLEEGQTVAVKEIVEFRLTVDELRAFLRSLMELERSRAEYETLRATRESISMVHPAKEAVPETSESSITNRPKDRRDLDYIG